MACVNKLPPQFERAAWALQMRLATHIEPGSRSAYVLSRVKQRETIANFLYQFARYLAVETLSIAKKHRGKVPFEEVEDIDALRLMFYPQEEGYGDF